MSLIGKNGQKTYDIYQGYGTETGKSFLKPSGGEYNMIL